MSFYLEYNDPLRIIWRSGTEDDPYVDKTDNLKIINNKIVLTEIPDEFEKVRIGGYSEIEQDTYGSKKKPKEKEFIVNYQNGIVTFNSSEENKTVVAEYKGRGVIQYPAERIYAHFPDPDVVDNLQNIIDYSYEKIEKAEIKIEEVEEAIEETKDATKDAKLATDNAHTQADNAEHWAEQAEQAAEDAKEAEEEAYWAAETTQLVWREYIETEDEIDEKFPNPKNGWTTMAKDTGVRYRYDGDKEEWIKIDNYTQGAIPSANEDTSGLMSSDHYVKLEEIESGATADQTAEEIHDLLEDGIKQKTIVFAIPSKPQNGVQDVNIRFPYSGNIEDIYALCGTPGSDYSTYINVEKSSKEDFIESGGSWESILNSDVEFRELNYVSEEVDIKEKNINKDDHFRVSVESFDEDIRDITLEIQIILI